MGDLVFMRVYSGVMASKGKNSWKVSLLLNLLLKVTVELSFQTLHNSPIPVMRVFLQYHPQDSIFSKASLLLKMPSKVTVELTAEKFKCLSHSFHLRLISIPFPGIHILKSQFASPWALYSVCRADFWEIVCLSHSSHLYLFSIPPSGIHTLKS